MLNSKRLASIANFIDESDNVADIGADHGKLVIELANKNKNKNFLAVENKAGPFKNLKNAVEKYNFNKNIECSFSDGIEYMPNYIDTLIFAGMGGINVINIISKHLDNLKNIKKIVFCVHKDAYLLELTLKKYGFFPTNHVFVTENDKTYIIFNTVFDLNKFNEFNHKKVNKENLNSELHEKYSSVVDALSKYYEKHLKTTIIGGLKNEN